MGNGVEEGSGWQLPTGASLLLVPPPLPDPVGSPEGRTILPSSRVDGLCRPSTGQSSIPSEGIQPRVGPFRTRAEGAWGSGSHGSLWFPPQSTSLTCALFFTQYPGCKRVNGLHLLRESHSISQTWRGLRGCKLTSPTLPQNRSSLTLWPGPSPLPIYVQ